MACGSSASLTATKDALASASSLLCGMTCLHNRQCGQQPESLSRTSVMNRLPSRSFPCLIVLGLMISPARGEDRVLKPGKPHEAGMSAERLEVVNQILTEETRSGRVTAA